MKSHEFDATHWDPRKIRRAREFGWFRQNEARMIAAARQKRADAEKKRKSAEAEQRRLAHWRKCSRCGGDMKLKTIEGVEVEECVSCRGVFFHRGELEQILLKHDEHRRSFFRRLLGFRKV